jgi:hypothetical protein
MRHCKIVRLSMFKVYITSLLYRERNRGLSANEQRRFLWKWLFNYFRIYIFMDTVTKLYIEHDNVEPTKLSSIQCLLYIVYSTYIIGMPKHIYFTQEMVNFGPKNEKYESKIDSKKIHWTTKILIHFLHVPAQNLHIPCKHTLFALPFLICRTKYNF